MTYVSVVGRETVRIAFLIAALNKLKIFSGDIQNACLNAYAKEKNYFYADDEWNANNGRTIITTRALYGLKSSSLIWRNYLADILGNRLKFRSFPSEPDL